MPREMARQKLVMKAEEDGCLSLRNQGNYVEVSPGRGKPRLRFRHKWPGLVANEKMHILVQEAGCLFREPKDLPHGPPEWAEGTKEERTAKRRRCMAELQQNWRPLEADGYRLVSLLLSCTHEGEFSGIDVNNTPSTRRTSAPGAREPHRHAWSLGCGHRWP